MAAGARERLGADVGRVRDRDRRARAAAPRRSRSGSCTCTSRRPRARTSAGWTCPAAATIVRARAADGRSAAAARACRGSFGARAALNRVRPRPLVSTNICSGAGTYVGPGCDNTSGAPRGRAERKVERRMERDTSPRGRSQPDRAPVRQGRDHEDGGLPGDGDRRRLDGGAVARRRPGHRRPAARPRVRGVRPGVVGQDDAVLPRDRRGPAHAAAWRRSSTPSTPWTRRTPAASA